LSDTELLDVRMRYLAGPAGRTWEAWTGSDPFLDPANDMRQWRAAIERHESYDELILWFEHDLFDQLNLIQLLTWIRDHLAARDRVSLICIGSFPGHPQFKGLGELTPDDIASLLDRRQPVVEPQYQVARHAWQAVREPTPETLDELRQHNTSALPYLAPAITRFLQEYPWTRDGLSRTERRLLELADREAIALWKAFPRMHEGEQVYYITDGSLAACAEALSHTSPPLVTLDDSRAGEGHVLRGIVALTDTGRSVLAGESDRVEICGIDRWLGGVHLQTGGELWRWDATRQRVTRA
jgi:hypothetical protein